MSDAMIGMGIAYAIKQASPSNVYDSVGEVYDVVPPNQQTDEVEATHYGSTGGYREFIPGLKDGGEVTFSINWIPGEDTDVLLRTLHGNGQTRTHRITFPNTAKIEFSGWVKGFERAAPMDDRMTATVTVRVTGPSTYTDPA